MAITVSSSATHTELTTLNTVKSELGIGSTNTTDDGTLVQMIQQSSDLITRYTGRTFAKQTYVETLPAFGFVEMMLTHTPIISVTGISYDGSTVSSTTYTIDDANAGILFRETGWTTTQLWSHNVEDYPLKTGKRDWSVTYVAGYVCPGSTASRTLPYDLERACIDLTKSLYNRRMDDPNVRRQRTGDSEEWRYEQTELPPVVQSVLDRWRRLEV